MTDADFQQLDDIVARIAAACAAAPEILVTTALIQALGEAIGRLPPKKRQPALQIITKQLAEYVAKVVRPRRHTMPLDAAVTQCSDPDDDRAEALAARIAAACRGETDHAVASELVGILGEIIGRCSTAQRDMVLNAVINDLRHYVSEIPPLPDDRESLD